MAIALKVLQSGGKLRVYAGNDLGNPVAIIDHIVLSIEWPTGSWHVAFYEDDFVFSPRVPAGWFGLMVEMNYTGGLPDRHAYAKADYWEVDQTGTSPVISLS